MFAARISLKSLTLVCRALSTLLSSGVPVYKAFKLASGKTGDMRCRQAMQDVTQDLHEGSDIATALRNRRGYFPRLMVDMVAVAEQTGALPEILARLAEHYETNRRLRNSFLAAITWPLIQLMLAIFIIAFVLLILGWIADTMGAEALDILGLGTGPVAAVRWLVLCFGSLFGVFALYWAGARYWGAKRFLDPLLLQVPVLGACMRTFAIARFSWGLALTQDAGMSILPSLKTSLQITGNGAFQEAIPRVLREISSGEDLTDTLAITGLFPDDYLQMVHVAETSGTVPEMLHRISGQLEEDARRSLITLTTALGWAVWAFVAAIIIYFIFKFALFYVGMLNSFQV